MRIHSNCNGVLHGDIDWDNNICKVRDIQRDHPDVSPSGKDQEAGHSCRVDNGQILVRNKFSKLEPSFIKYSRGYIHFSGKGKVSQTDLGLRTVCVQKHHFIEDHLMLLYIQVEKHYIHRRVTSASWCGKWKLEVTYFLLGRKSGCTTAWSQVPSTILKRGSMGGVYTDLLKNILPCILRIHYNIRAKVWEKMWHLVYLSSVISRKMSPSPIHLSVSFFIVIPTQIEGTKWVFQGVQQVST